MAISSSPPADYKAVGLVQIRRFLEDAGRDQKKLVADALSDEARRTFTTVVATQWVPIAHVIEVYEAAAPLLHQGKPDAMRLLGRDIAEADMRGVYRLLVRALSTSMLVQSTARLWPRYNRRGDAEMLALGPRHAQLRVANHPGYTRPFRELTAGWIERFMVVSGADDARVIVDDGEAPTWIWRCTWS